MIVGQLESGCCSCYILESCLQKWNSIEEEIDHVLGNRGENITRHRAATNESDEWFLSFLSLYTEIIELYLFSGARSLLFAKLKEDQMIRKSSRLWNSVESFFKLLFGLISCITVIFFNRFSLETSLFHYYNTLIYLSTLADFPFWVR